MAFILQNLQAFSSSSSNHYRTNETKSILQCEPVHLVSIEPKICILKAGMCVAPVSTEQFDVYIVYTQLLQIGRICEILENLPLYISYMHYCRLFNIINVKTIHHMKTLAYIHQRDSYNCNLKLHLLFLCTAL